jgi:hypothetical protein
MVHTVDIDTTVMARSRLALCTESCNLSIIVYILQDCNNSNQLLSESSSPSPTLWEVYV